MRLIEKSLTENIYNALNESFDSDKATKRVARYKKSNRLRMNESEEAQLNDLYNASKVEWDDLSGSDQAAVEYFSSNFGDNIENKSWDEVESDIIEACYEIGYAKKGKKDIASLLLKNVDDFPDYLEIEKKLKGLEDLKKYSQELVEFTSLYENASSNIIDHQLERNLLNYIRR